MIATTHNNTKKKKEEAVDAIYMLYFIRGRHKARKRNLQMKKKGGKNILKKLIILHCQLTFTHTHKSNRGETNRYCKEYYI